MSQTQFVPQGEEAAGGAVGGPPAEETQGYESVGHVYANSWGIYFLGKLPYLTGGIDGEGYPEWRYFENATTVQTVVQLLREEALRRGATHLVDLQSDYLSSWSSTTIVFWILEADASANALRVTGTPPPGAISLRTSR